MTWLFVMLSLISVAATIDALSPFRAPARRALYSFVIGFVTIEAAPLHLLIQVAFVAFCAWHGVLATWPGQVALLLFAGSWIGLGYCVAQTRLAEGAVRNALKEACPDISENELSRDFKPHVSWKNLFLPFPFRPRGVERIKDIVFTQAGGVNLKLDVYRRTDEGTSGKAPVLFYIHGGAWILGSKNEQGLPLLHRMAASGWVCVSANYRLSPKATFPEHLIDLKHAVRWIREHVAEYGGDPDFVIVSGGSAGGHLAALVALTANRPEFQPGFEEVDTSMWACVPFYGIYDFQDRFGHWPNSSLKRLLKYRVMKTTLEASPEVYEKASPVSWVDESAPPFFVVHGNKDTLVPVDESRRFVEVLRERSKAPVGFAEIAGAQHAFETYPSIRSEMVGTGVALFLQQIYRQHQQQKVR